MKTFLKRAALAAGAILIAATSQAATFVYDLSDHPSGNQAGNFDYGLRLDKENPDLFITFDNGSAATLEYDDVALTATISGTVFQSTGVGTTGDAYTLRYTMTDLTDLGGGFFEQRTANASTGTLTLNSDPSQVISLGSEALNGVFFRFADDGHRLPGNPSTGIVGRGWVGQDAGQEKPNDFLFTATLDPNGNTPPPVPLPAAGWMLLAGIGGMAAMRRRKATR